MKRSDQRLSLLYFISDLITLNVVLVTALNLFQQGFLLEYDALSMASLNLTWMICASLGKIYYLHLHNSFRLRFLNYLRSHFYFGGLVSLVYLVFNLPAYLKSVIIVLVVGFPVLGFIVNYLLVNILSRLRAKGRNQRKALVVGAGKAAVKIDQHFRSNLDFGYKIIGFLEDNIEVSPLANRVIGQLRDLDQILKTKNIDEVIIAISSVHQAQIKNIIHTADYYGIRTRLVPDFHDLIGSKYNITKFGDLPILNVREISLDTLYMSTLKRVFDVLFSSVVLIFLAPVFLALAILIKLDSNGPVFYCPVRIGRAGYKFKVFKFRSMYVGDSAVGGTKSTTKNDERITSIGKVIRKYSLDELPQFINVLLGDMSVVGPRPHRVFLNELMQREVGHYMVRHYLKPGITGWAQVNGWRGPTDTDEQRSQRTSHDLWYVENWSLALDIKIIYLTVFGEKTHAVAF